MCVCVGGGVVRVGGEGGGGQGREGGRGKRKGGAGGRNQEHTLKEAHKDERIHSCILLQVLSRAMPHPKWYSC